MHPKTVRLTQKGTDTELHLCQLCADPYLASSNALATSTTSQTKLTPDGELHHSVVSKNIINPDSACPKCGSTAEDIARSKKAGCDMCYEVHDILKSSVTATQNGASNHEGKQPSRFNWSEKINYLKKQLADAIKKEDYEKASLLRDAIAQLEKNLDGGSD